MSGVAALRSELLGLYAEFPFEHHPLWCAVRDGALTREQVVRAEVQHFIRTRAGQELRRQAAADSVSLPAVVSGPLIQTYKEECSPADPAQSHLALVERILKAGGLARGDYEAAVPTPGNVASIAMYREISSRGVICHLVGSGCVEHYYAKLVPAIFMAYTTRYGFTSDEALTYNIHAEMDTEHAARALGVLEDAVKLIGRDALRGAVRAAFIATSLHYDGMLQGATGTTSFWDGRST